jgi:hypothetical protein
MTVLSGRSYVESRCIDGQILEDFGPVSDMFPAGAIALSY